MNRFALFLLFCVQFSTAGVLINVSDSTAPGLQYNDTIIDGVHYIDSDVFELVKNFDTRRWYPYKEKLALKSNMGSIQLTNKSTYILFNDDSLIVAEEPALYKDDIFWIPASMLPDLNPLMPQQLYFVNDSVLHYKAESGLVALKVQQKTNGTLVELEFSKPYTFDQWFHAPHYILRFNGLEIDPEKWKNSYSKGVIKKIIPVREEHLSQITFEVRPSMDEVEIFNPKGSKKIQLLFRKKQQQDAVIVEKGPNKRIKNIIIDAGHGGKDPGAHGLRYNEKDITLKVAKELSRILKKAGYNPILTRDSDKYLTLQERPKFATDHEGDMFISLHCNAIPGSVRKKNRVKGFKIYILREAKSEDDKAIARRENAALSEVSQKSKKEISPVEWILLEHQLNLFTKKSEQLAGHLIESLTDNQRTIQKMGYGAGQAGFYVLVGALMPAVLVELGFISNPKEEVYMNSAKGVKELSQGIYKAIENYKETIENR